MSSFGALIIIPKQVESFTVQLLPSNKNEVMVPFKQAPELAGK